MNTLLPSNLLIIFFIIISCTDGLEKRFGSLSASVSERAEQLQTAVAQSVSVQEGLNGLLSWLDKLILHPGPVEPTTHAVQEALTQNQVSWGFFCLCFFLEKRGKKELSQSFLVKKTKQINSLYY